MKKSIALVALAASSSSAFALVGPNTIKYEVKTVCLSSYTHDDGSLEASSCDESRNNAQAGRRLLENGCAEDQIAIQATRPVKPNAVWSVNVRTCMPPNLAQL